MLQPDLISQEANNNSTVAPERKPLIRKLNFDDSSPGIPSKFPLSKCIITKEKRGYSDSHLSNPMYRKNFYDSEPDSDDSPGLLFQLGINPQSIPNMLNPHKTHFFNDIKPLQSQIIEEESAGTKTSLDSECDNFNERIIQLSTLPPRRISKSTPSHFSGPFQNDIVTKTIFGEPTLENTELEAETKEISPKTDHLVLPVIKNIRDPELHTISVQTLVDLMNNPKGLNYLVIDCRYEYEYKGGHIKGAINLYSPETLEKLFFTHRNLIHNSVVLDEIKKDMKSVIANHRSFPPFEAVSTYSNTTVLIFHCEFSQKRGPRAWRYLRSLDRESNRDRFPQLHYPQMYVLEGGYNLFQSKFPSYCSPEGGYVGMFDKNYKQELAHAKEEEIKLWKKKYSIDIVSGMEGLRISDKDV